MTAPARILEAVAARFSTTTEQLLSRSRSSSKARQAAALVLRSAGCSWSTVSRTLRRSHGAGDLLCKRGERSFVVRSAVKAVCDQLGIRPLGSAPDVRLVRVGDEYVRTVLERDGSETGFARKRAETDGLLVQFADRDALVPMARLNELGLVRR